MLYKQGIQASARVNITMSIVIRYVLATIDVVFKTAAVAAAMFGVHESTIACSIAILCILYAMFLCVYV